MFVKVNKKVGANQLLETFLNLQHVQEIQHKEGNTTIVLIRGATFNVKETPAQILDQGCNCSSYLKVLKLEAKARKERKGK